jgi:hypothetical protein
MLYVMVQLFCLPAPFRPSLMSIIYILACVMSEVLIGNVNHECGGYSQKSSLWAPNLKIDPKMKVIEPNESYKTPQVHFSRTGFVRP